jgi:hypothetical protein
MSTDADQELKSVQLAAARLDLRQKEFEAASRPGFLKSTLTNPAAIGALLSAFVAINIALFGFVTSRVQMNLEQAKAQNQLELERKKYESSLILAAVRTGNPDQAAENMKFLLDTGLVSDQQGRLHEYLSKRHPGTGKTLPVRSGEIVSPESTDSGKQPSN